MRLIFRQEVMIDKLTWEGDPTAQQSCRRWWEGVIVVTWDLDKSDPIVRRWDHCTTLHNSPLATSIDLVWWSTWSTEPRDPRDPGDLTWSSHFISPRLSLSIWVHHQSAHIDFDLVQKTTDLVQETTLCVLFVCSLCLPSLGHVTILTREWQFCRLSEPWRFCGDFVNNSLTSNTPDYINQNRRCGFLLSDKVEIFRLG